MFTLVTTEEDENGLCYVCIYELPDSLIAHQEKLSEGRIAEVLEDLWITPEIFKANFLQSRNEIRNTIFKKIFDRKGKTIIVFAVGGVLSAAFPLAALPLLGFTSSEIAAGSIGAWMMSTMGTYGGIVALCQSIGAAGMTTASSALLFLSGGSLSSFAFWKKTKPKANTAEN